MGQNSETLTQKILEEADTASVLFGQHSDFSHLAKETLGVDDSDLMDTVVVRDSQMIGYNCMALGIKAVLLQENIQSSFADQEVLVISQSLDEARTTISVLQSLSCRKVWTLGFTTGTDIRDKLAPLDMKVLNDCFNPVGIFCISTSHDRSILASLITMVAERQNKKRILYLDTERSPNNPAMTTAKALGWRIITQEQISSAVVVERLRVSVDQSVPYSFVQMVKRQQLS